MAASLIKIKGFIQTYSGYNFENITDSEFEELKNFINQALFDLRWEMEDDLNNIKEDAAKKKYVYDFQSKLTYMAESISEFDRENRKNYQVSPVFGWLQTAIFELLDHIRIYFSTFFVFKMELPAGFTGSFKPRYKSFEGLQEKVAGSNLDPNLATLIINFNGATDKSERFRVRTWQQWDFLVKTIVVTDHFLDDPPDGDINLELLKLFICREFNSIQVYAYFLKYIEKTTASEAGYQEQKQELLYFLKVFKQVRVEAKHSYDPNMQPLKTSVLESLNAEIEYLDEKQRLFLQNFKSTNPESPSKFYFGVAATLGELMFLFRLMLEVGFIQTKFNSYLYEFISNHIRTKKAENISKKSMRNHFNNKPFPDRVVQNVRLWLTKMIAHLDLYYKLNL